MRAFDGTESERMQPPTNGQTWESYSLPGLRPGYRGSHSELLEESESVGNSSDGSEAHFSGFPDFNEAPTTIQAPWWISILKAGLAVVVIYMLVYLLTMSLLLESPQP